MQSPLPQSPLRKDRHDFGRHSTPIVDAHLCDGMDGVMFGPMSGKADRRLGGKAAGRRVNPALRVLRRC